MAEKLVLMAAAPGGGAPMDVEKNKEAMLALVLRAKQNKADLLVMPELCLSSSGAGSLFHNRAFLTACEEAAFDIAKECEGLVCVFGLPVYEGHRVYNALAVAHEGEIKALVVKQNLNSAQTPFFKPAFPEGQTATKRQIPLVKQADLPLPVPAAAAFYDDLKAFPVTADVVAAPALIPATAGMLDAESLLGEGLTTPVMVLANAGRNESSTDLVYPGQAAVFSRGQLEDYAEPFKDKAALAALSLPLEHETAVLPPQNEKAMSKAMPYAPEDPRDLAAWCRDAVEIAAQALATRMRRIHIKAVTLGVSGGLDSAMALVIIRRAFEILGLDRKGIYAYSLPGLGSSGRTRGNAKRLMAAFGLEPREVDLTASILQHFRDIEQNPDTHDAAFENAQARERTQFLMDKANQVQGMMVGTGDLSELALGFTTFNGDHMSMYGVNGGLYKTAIRLILRDVAETSGNIELSETLRDILDTPISPELLPGGGEIKQKTEDILGPYELNDFFLHLLLTRPDLDPGQYPLLLKEAFGEKYGETEVKTRFSAFVKRFFQSQFKRNCMPDGPQVLGVSLSPRGGFALPSDASPSVFHNSALYGKEE